MENSRREFLKGTAWMGVAAMAAGCISKGNALGFGAGGSMHGFRVAPMKRVRVGVIGVGSRGTPAVQRIAQIPGCEVTAIHAVPLRNSLLLFSMMLISFLQFVRTVHSTKAGTPPQASAEDLRGQARPHFADSLTGPTRPDS